MRCCGRHPAMVAVFAVNLSRCSSAMTYPADVSMSRTPDDEFSEEKCCGFSGTAGSHNDLIKCYVALLHGSLLFSSAYHLVAWRAVLQVKPIGHSCACHCCRRSALFRRSSSGGGPLPVLRQRTTLLRRLRPSSRSCLERLPRKMMDTLSTGSSVQMFR